MDAASIDWLQFLDKDNARLRLIVAELLLKNQLLRLDLQSRNSPAS